ncbi:patatin-like phospholipase family protein [Saccharopolyspora sp. WRP15-2]|uniref:Patatin-like phospholipase family protein n=1 Tax=Saccharopolyspora oryzae TaxID=2997343 RepID=A0ABT4V961_9PSEU|nr:patatin-like phospholipase family protein [Saccharopolyspora oryzae]MDA3630506.1 patatin-like phospholipase family protein [Saccharopolyspora oryzae]
MTGLAGPDGTAVVLGAGGVVGTAWMSGLAAGLRRQGVDLAQSDAIVGTSAGAIVGAMLTTGRDLDLLAEPPRPTGPAPKRDSGVFAEVFAVLTEPELAPEIARRRVGQLAISADTDSEEAQIDRMDSLVAARDWPPGTLLVTAVDAETGQRRVWDREDGVPLLSAVASSMAFPGASPTITINGRRYMDGALWSSTNADLATGARTVVVIDPQAHLFPREPLHRELDVSGADSTVMINPDRAAIDDFGPDLNDRKAWQPAYRAGTRQAAEAVEQLRTAYRVDR